VKLPEKDFRKQLEQYIQFRGIDIILHLKDGTRIELDKNRRIDGDIVIRHTRDGKKEGIPLEDIVKADFYAA